MVEGWLQIYIKNTIHTVHSVQLYMIQYDLRSAKAQDHIFLTAFLRNKI